MTKKNKLKDLINKIPHAYDTLSDSAYEIAEKYNKVDATIEFIETHPKLTPSDLVIFLTKINPNIPEPFEPLKYSFEE